MSNMCRRTAKNDKTERIRTPRLFYCSLIAMFQFTLILITAIPTDGFLNAEYTDRFRGKADHKLRTMPRFQSKMDSTESESDRQQIPRHIAFICDGNSRWARGRNLLPISGHAKGAGRVVDMVQALQRRGVEVCTLYGFSSENWKRPASEIKTIFSVVEQTANTFYDRALRENIQVRILGDLDDERLPRSLVKSLKRLERDTATDKDGKLTVCLAVNYGGRQDILKACREIAQLAVNGEIQSVSDVDENLFSASLCTRGIPDPDLVIRTSGESRLSNFLLWNIAYAELYFTDVLWPDFDEDRLNDALAWYGSRERRMGGRKQEASTTVQPPQ